MPGVLPSAADDAKFLAMCKGFKSNQEAYDLLCKGLVEHVQARIDRRADERPDQALTGASTLNQSSVQLTLAEKQQKLQRFNRSAPYSTALRIALELPLQGATNRFSIVDQTIKTMSTPQIGRIDQAGQFYSDVMVRTRRDVLSVLRKMSLDPQDLRNRIDRYDNAVLAYGNGFLDNGEVIAANIDYRSDDAIQSLKRTVREILT